MNILSIIAKMLGILFLGWEIFKILKPKVIWNEAKNSVKVNKSSKSKIQISYISIIENIYIGFTILLFFTKWWLIGIFLIIISIVSALFIAPILKKSENFNPRISHIIIGDSLVSIIILLLIFLK